MAGSCKVRTITKSIQASRTRESTMSTGANYWRAEFRLKGSTVFGVVDHRWNDPFRHECHLGTELASGSPWRWHIVGLDGGDRCGRAETPVLAAFAAEGITVAAGTTIATRTALRRIIPG